jgi:hypothetical protein
MVIPSGNTNTSAVSAAVFKLQFNHANPCRSRAAATANNTAGDAAVAAANDATIRRQKFWS